MAPKSKKTVETPEPSKPTIEELTTKVTSLRDTRLDYERLAEDIKKQEQTMHADILALLAESGLESARTSAGTVTRQTKQTVGVKDFPALLRFAADNNPACVQMRAGERACLEMLEQGVVIPGIEVGTRVSLSITKGAK